MKWLMLCALVACVDSGPGPQGKKIDPQYVQQHLLSAVPPDIERFDLPVGDSLIYLGNKVDKPRVPPGQPVTINHYWKVIKPIGDRWSLFTHVRGAGGSADFMNLPPTDMQLGHGPTTWQAGELVEDVQTFVLRPDWRSIEATVLVGLIERGEHTSLDRMNVDGPRTRDRAIIARKLEVDLAHAPSPKGTTYITHAQGAINIDGLANDPGWASIPGTELVTAEGGTDPIGKAVAKLTWDDTYLYAFVTVVDSDIVAPFKQHDEEFWKGDCVELFIDADGNKQGYVELQVNPNNATFDKWYATTRSGPGDMTYEANMTTAVKLRGATDAGDSGDQGWDVEIAIPWDAIKGKNPDMKVRLPPQVGDRWRLNLVRVDRKTGGKENEVFASSWNRITMSDFHAVERMLVGVFADESGSIVPQAKPKDSGSGSGSAGSGSAAGSGSGSGSGSAAAIVLPAAVKQALLATQQAIEVEVFPATTKFAGFDLTDDQLAELLKLAVARSRDVELRVRAVPGIQAARFDGLTKRARELGITKVTAVPPTVPRTGSGSAGSASITAPRTGSGSGAGSAVRPATGSGAGSAVRPATGSGAGSNTLRPGSGSGNTR